MPLTPYVEANAILEHIVHELRGVLGEKLAAVLVYGSLALGDFNPKTSDVDFVVASQEPLTEPLLDALAAMHRRMFHSGLALADQLECSYFPLADLRRYHPARTLFPHLDRGEETLSIQQHDTDWIVQRYSLREVGFAAFGPPPSELVDLVTPGELRQAVLDLLWWWELQLKETHRVAQPGYQVYAVLSMCRILYTLRQGGIASKPAAARWALQHVPARFHPLISRATVWQDGAMDRLNETLAFIEFVLSQQDAPLDRIQPAP